MTACNFDPKSVLGSGRREEIYFVSYWHVKTLWLSQHTWICNRPVKLSVASLRYLGVSKSVTKTKLPRDIRTFNQPDQRGDYCINDFFTINNGVFRESNGIIVPFLRKIFRSKCLAQPPPPCLLQCLSKTLWPIPFHSQLLLMFSRKVLVEDESWVTSPTPGKPSEVVIDVLRQVVVSGNDGSLSSGV